VHVQRLVSVVKTVTVLEKYTTEQQSSVARFLWPKDSMQRMFIKQMFPVNGGKCLSCKAVHNWVEKFSQGRSKFADGARPGAEVTETRVKRLLCCGFRHTGKAMRQVYQYSSRICREFLFSPVSNTACFTLYIHL
jgi:hypothetical protein